MIKRDQIAFVINYIVDYAMRVQPSRGGEKEKGDRGGSDSVLPETTDASIANRDTRFRCCLKK